MNAAGRHGWRGCVACLLSVVASGCVQDPSHAMSHGEATSWPMTVAGDGEGPNHEAASMQGDPRSTRIAGGSVLPDGWHAEVRVPSGCLQSRCRHWILRSADGTQRIEWLPARQISETRGTTPDIVHHAADRVRWRLQEVRREWFPGAGEGRFEPMPELDAGYGARDTGERMVLDHVRDGVALRSVIEVVAVPWQRPRDVHFLDEEPPMMGITTIDLEISTIIYTAPAQGFDLQALSSIASGYQIERQSFGHDASAPQSQSVEGAW